jgi:hypothetical protein
MYQIKKRIAKKRPTIEAEHENKNKNKINMPEGGFYTWSELGGENVYEIPISYYDEPVEDFFEPRVYEEFVPAKQTMFENLKYESVLPFRVFENLFYDA